MSKHKSTGGSKPANQQAPAVTKEAAVAPVTPETQSTDEQTVVTSESTSAVPTLTQTGGDSMEGGEGTDTTSTASTVEVEVEAAEETVESFLMNRHNLKVIPFEIESIINRLKTYADRMNPLVPNTVDDMLNYQWTLQRTILACITIRDTKNSQDAGISESNGAYIVALDALMWFFRKYKDAAFNELNLHRRLEQLRIDKNQYEFLKMILSAMCMIVNEPQRKRSIKWGAITKELNNVNYQARILAYFVNGK